MKKYKQTLVVKFEAYLTKDEYKQTLEVMESKELQSNLDEWSEDLKEAFDADSAEILHLTLDMEE